MVPKMETVTYSRAVLALTIIRTKATMVKMAARPWLMEFQSSSARVYFGTRIDIRFIITKSPPNGGLLCFPCYLLFALAGAGGSGGGFAGRFSGGH